MGVEVSTAREDWSCRGIVLTFAPGSSVGRAVDTVLVNLFEGEVDVFVLGALRPVVAAIGR